MKVMKMNMAQIHGAIAGFSEWISQSPDFPFKPAKIEYAGELDRFGMHHYILKFRRPGGPWILGVAGGYENDTEIAPFQYVGSMGTLFSESTMRKNAEILLDDMHQYFEAHPDDDMDSDMDLDDDWDDDDDDDGSGDASAFQVVFLPKKARIPAARVIRALKKNWHVKARETMYLTEETWEAEVDGWYFTVTQMPLPERIKNSALVPPGNQEMAEMAHKILACGDVLIVGCDEKMTDIKKWGSAYAMLVDACVEAGSGIGVVSGSRWIGGDTYHTLLQESIQAGKWPFSNFFDYETECSKVSSGEIVTVSLQGQFALSLPSIEVTGFYSREEIPRLKNDLRELAELFLFGDGPDKHGDYIVSSGRRYRDMGKNGIGRDFDVSFIEWGLTLDSTEQIMKTAAQKGICLKRIVEAGKRSAWFLRWVNEKAGIEPKWMNYFDHSLNNPKYAGDWRYVLRYEQNGFLNSSVIPWKLRLFAESYYLGKGKKGYRGQLKSYALKRLKGTKQEGLARLAGMNAFAYLPWDEETYRDVAAMIESAYTVWQEEHR